MKRLCGILALFVVGELRADWLCKQASSRAVDNTFYACGHSLANSLIEARENALKAAKREFEAFCNESANCKDYAYTIAPLRTDCNKEGNQYSCYRGLEYTILPQKRLSMKVNKDEIRRLIKDKEFELSELEEGMAEIEKLSNIEERIERIKQVDKAEVEVEYLKNHVLRDYKHTTGRGIALKIVGINTPLKKDDSSGADSVVLAGLGIEYDSVLWKNVSMKMSLSYVLGREDSKLDDRGTPNTTSETQYHSHKGYDASIGFPISFSTFSISPNVGYLALSYKSTQYQYNNFGVGLNKTEKSYKYNAGYAGLALRYGKEWFIEIEPRHYFKDSKSSLGASLGMRIEF